MADEIRQPGEPLPGPDVPITRTRVWLRLRHPESASPAEAVIMNNMAVLADQLSQLLALQTGTSLGGRKRRRTSSVGSAASTATDARGDGSDAEMFVPQNEADTINTAIENLSGAEGKWSDTLYDTYKVFTEETGSYKYRTASKKSGSVAEAFWKHCVDFFSPQAEEVMPGIEEESPIDDLKRLTNIDAKIRVYIDFGKRFHEDTKAATARKSPRAGTAGPDSQATGTGDSQGTRTGGSQQSRASKRRKTRGKKTGKNVSFDSEIAASEDGNVDSEDEDE